MDETTGTSRRGFLAAVIAGTAGAWLVAHARELDGAARLAASGGDEWMYLTDEQAATLDAVSAQIIPSDGTPGAREAKVVRFIDRAYATFMQDQRADLTKALADLADATARTIPGATSFSALTSNQQVTVLTAYENKKDGSFPFFRLLTIAGMFSMPSYGGNDQKVGWKMIGFEDRFVWTPPFGWYDRA